MPTTDEIANKINNFESTTKDLTLLDKSKQLRAIEKEVEANASCSKEELFKIKKLILDDLQKNIETVKTAEEINNLQSTYDILNESELTTNDEIKSLLSNIKNTLENMVFKGFEDKRLITESFNIGIKFIALNVSSSSYKERINELTMEIQRYSNISNADLHTDINETYKKYQSRKKENYAGTLPNKDEIHKNLTNKQELYRGMSFRLYDKTYILREGPNDTCPAKLSHYSDGILEMTCQGKPSGKKLLMMAKGLIYASGNSLITIKSVNNEGLKAPLALKLYIAIRLMGGNAELGSATKKRLTGPPDYSKVFSTLKKMSREDLQKIQIAIIDGKNMSDLSPDNDNEQDNSKKPIAKP